MCPLPRAARARGRRRRPHPLAGEKSPGQLATVIQRTMPDDDPGSCSEDEDRLVAAYIHRRVLLAGRPGPAAPAAGGPVAPDRRAIPQRRSRPDRRIPSRREARRPAGLARRVFQLEGHSATTSGSSIASIRRSTSISAPAGAGRRGCGGVGRQFGRRRRNSTRTSSASAGKARCFAAETGDYEFVVRTEQALRLWVNDAQEPLDRRHGEIRDRHGIPRRRSS